jgi:hypothetical protein
MSKIPRLVTGQEPIVAEVAVVESMRPVALVHVKVLQVKVAVDRARLRIAEQASHALELLRPVDDAGCVEFVVTVRVLYITCPEKKIY